MKGATCTHNTGFSKGRFIAVVKDVIAIFFFCVRFLCKQLTTPWLHQLLFVSAVVSMMCVLKLFAYEQKMIKRAEGSSVAGSSGKIKKPQAAERVYGVLDYDSRIKTTGSKSILYSKSSGVTSAIATTVPVLLLSDSRPKSRYPLRFHHDCTY